MQRSWLPWVAMAALLVLAALPAAAQTPLLDLSINGSASWDGTSLVIHLEGLSLNHDPWDTPLNTNLRIYLDGVLVSEYPLELLWPSSGDCPGHMDPDCGNGTCDPMWVNGQVVWPQCMPSMFQGPAWDDLPPWCYCGAYMVVEDDSEPYHGESFARLVIDEDNTIPEIDETNNEVILDLAPVASEAWTWTRIKGWYR